MRLKQQKTIDLDGDKAPLDLKLSDKIQQIRGKNGSIRSILFDGREIPLPLVVSGAQTHDVKLLEATLDKIVLVQSETPILRRQHV